MEGILHEQDFLAAFVKMQHPTESRILTNNPPHQSTAHWTVDLPSDVPGLVKKLVGNAFSLELWIQTSPKGQLRLNASGKAKGFLDANLLVQPNGKGTAVDITGKVTVSAGVLGGPAAKMARDEVIRPVLVEDFFPLLNDWCAKR